MFSESRGRCLGCSIAAISLSNRRQTAYIYLYVLVESKKEKWKRQSEKDIGMP